MTERQAKDILLRYRPGSPDAGEPDMVEALALARRSPELKAWFETHCLAQTAISLQFRKITVPPGLKEQILSEHKAHQASFWPKSTKARLTCVAVAALIVLLSLQWVKPSVDRTDEEGLSFYRGQMISRVLRAYGMDLETNSLPAVRAYLAEQKLDADWTLPTGIHQASLTGCGILGWRDRKVSMICFHSGKPLPPGQQTDLFLFVVDRNSIHDAPDAGKMEWAQVSQLTTVTWSEGNRTYVLAGVGDKDFLKKFL